MTNKYLKIIVLWVALVFAVAFPVSAFDFHSGVAGGSDTEVLFNDSGQVAGDAGMTYDKAADTLSIGRMATGQLKWAKGADVASANALPLGIDGNYFDITGATTITSINTLDPGILVLLHFDGALTLTHHVTNLILPGEANIVTVAGDEAVFIEYATGDWRCVCYNNVLTTPNDRWVTGANYAGSALINMFKVNADDEIDVGTTINIGDITFAEDSGIAVAMDMPVSTTPAANTEESYVFKLDGNNVLAIHSQADSAGGVFGLGTELSGGSIITIDATVTTLDYLALADESAYTIKATITAKQNNSDQRSSFIIAGLFYRNGAGAVQQGATTVIQTLESDVNTACVFDVNGNNVRVRVTGIAAETWEWKCHLEIMKVD